MHKTLGCAKNLQLREGGGSSGVLPSDRQHLEFLYAGYIPIAPYDA